MALDIEELVRTLVGHPDWWKSTAIRGEVGRIEWFPIVRVGWSTRATAIGVDRRGRWILGGRTDRDLEGHSFDPTATKGFLYLVAMLDWSPRTVMGDAAIVADIVGLPPDELWELVPWRYVIHSALVGGRMQYVKPAVDWLWYLDVFEEFRDHVAALLDEPRERADVDVDWIENVLAQPPLAWSPVDAF